MVRDARGVSSSRKTCGLPNDLAARFVAHCVRSCSACVGRLLGPCRPFQSHPQQVDQPPGGTERGRALDDPRRSKHWRPLRGRSRSRELRSLVMTKDQRSFEPRTASCGSRARGLSNPSQSTPPATHTLRAERYHNLTVRMGDNVLPMYRVVHHKTNSYTGD